MMGTGGNHDDSAEPEEEFSIGISTDGVRQSVPWKLDDYGDNGALNDLQIEELAVSFSFTRNQLRELSWGLGRALGDLPTISLISRSKAETAAAAQLKRSQQDLVVASSKLNSAKARLNHLSMEDVIDDHGQDWISSTTNRMNNLDDQVQALVHEFNQVAEEPGRALLLRHANKSKIPDHRRDKVLSTILRFWHADGRKLTYTTDPLNSERRGALIVFTNAIVRCVSDPPGALSGEAIIANIKDHKAKMEVAASVLDVSKEANRPT